MSACKNGRRIVSRTRKLPFGFAFAIDKMVSGKMPWWRPDRYAWFMRYSNGTIKAWQARVLWFYFGRASAVRTKESP